MPKTMSGDIGYQSALALRPLACACRCLPSRTQRGGMAQQQRFPRRAQGEVSRQAGDRQASCFPLPPSCPPALREGLSPCSRTGQAGDAGQVPTAGRKPGISALSTRLGERPGELAKRPMAGRQGWRDPFQATTGALPCVLSCSSPAAGKSFWHWLESTCVPRLGRCRQGAKRGMGRQRWPRMPQLRL